MPYINADGTVCANPPFIKRATNILWGFVDLITIFFRTLIPGLNNNNNNRYVSSYRRPGGGPPPPPQRRMGGFKTLSDCRAPMPGGG